MQLLVPVMRCLRSSHTNPIPQHCSVPFLPACDLQEGWNKFYMRAAETRWLPLGLLAGSVFWVYTGLTAGLEQWLGYVQLFDESRLVHATSLDFMLCTLLMYFWMSNDAQGRNWDKRWAADNGLVRFGLHQLHLLFLQCMCSHTTRHLTGVSGGKRWPAKNEH